MPHQFTYRGSRLVFSRGIVALGLIASGLVILFRASVTALIPLWAIGVFLSFTLSQTGMALRWRKIGRLKPDQELKERGSVLRYDQTWRYKIIINSVGAVVTFVVTIVFAATKFSGGAWIIIILLPLIVIAFMAIHRHYRTLAANLSLKHNAQRTFIRRHRVIVPISDIHEGTLAALNYARVLSHDVTAVFVSLDPVEAEKVKNKWDIWGEGTRLVILESPFRLLLEPLMDYIDEITKVRQANEVITIVVPQFVPRRWWHNFLHTQTATWLRFALLFRPGIVVTDVPYHVELGEDK